MSSLQKIVVVGDAELWDRLDKEGLIVSLTVKKSLKDWKMARDKYAADKDDFYRAYPHLRGVDAVVGCFEGERDLDLFMEESSTELCAFLLPRDQPLFVVLGKMGKISPQKCVGFSRNMIHAGISPGGRHRDPFLPSNMVSGPRDGLNTPAILYGTKIGNLQSNPRRVPVDAMPSGGANTLPSPPFGTSGQATLASSHRGDGAQFGGANTIPFPPFGGLQPFGMAGQAPHATLDGTGPLHWGDGTTFGGANTIPFPPFGGLQPFGMPGQAPQATLDRTGPLHWGDGTTFGGANTIPFPPFGGLQPFGTSGEANVSTTNRVNMYDLDRDMPPYQQLGAPTTDQVAPVRSCANCSCGMAKAQAASTAYHAKAAQHHMGEPNTLNQTSACGNCYLGDAFRCAACPHAGRPAFSQTVMYPEH